MITDFSWAAAWTTKRHEKARKRHKKFRRDALCFFVAVMVCDIRLTNPTQEFS
jgi:hypothetical protein